MKVRELVAILTAAEVDQEADVQMFEYECTSRLRTVYQEKPGTVWLTSQTPEAQFGDPETFGEPDVMWFVCPAVKS